MRRSVFSAVMVLVCACGAAAQVFEGNDPAALAGGEVVAGDESISLISGGQRLHFESEAALEAWLMNEKELAAKANREWIEGGGDVGVVLEFALVRRADAYNLTKKNVAIKGYDPVAYFPEGGGKPAKGGAAFEAEYDGAVYRFLSAKNRERFIMNPSRYEPAYGGWCAWAMSKGDTVEVDPKEFIVSDDGRLLLFYRDTFTKTRKKWLKSKTDRRPDADANWVSNTGEPARSSE